MVSKLILITGMPSSGKTSLARLLESELRKMGVCALHIDGIDLREMLGEFDFKKGGMERVMDFLVSFLKVLKEKNVIIILSIVAPFESIRRKILRIMEHFHIHLVCDVDILKDRDSKGLYKASDEGKMYLPGYTQEYEEPKESDLVFDTSKVSLDYEVKEVLSALKERGWI